ncbi:MAG: SAM-dependent methyltransferase [Haloplasmataceae bacterium]|jgi:SAM-dependent methyltransferase|nr:SAM-dependent methyltransferase [Haloplasmataceae bacterium]
MEEIIKIFKESIKNNEFILCVFSNPRVKINTYHKITAKLVEIKDIKYIQFSMQKDNKEYHANVLIEDVDHFLNENVSQYKQIQLYTEQHDYHILLSKNGEVNIKANNPSKSKSKDISHNRTKNYILGTDQSNIFLKELGIMDTSENIKPTKYDKYKQINRYLEFIQDIIPTLEEKSVIRIIDFGCGKSYLTFAMYHYFKEILNKNVEIVGLDLKTDVIEFCNKLAKNLHFDNLHFQVGDIGKYTTDKEIDMVVSLHACNTATDAALAKAINWNAKVILAVPCCHHEAYEQIQNETMSNFLKYGIIKEKFATLITDSLRANLLECYGYKVNVVEFIDMEHTPKNILIRAIRTTDANLNEAEYQKYLQLSKEFNLNLSLPKMLSLNVKR